MREEIVLKIISVGLMRVGSKGSRGDRGSRGSRGSRGFRGKRRFRGILVNLINLILDLHISTHIIDRFKPDTFIKTTPTTQLNQNSPSNLTTPHKAIRFRVYFTQTTLWLISNFLI